MPLYDIITLYNIKVNSFHLPLLEVKNIIIEMILIVIFIHLLHFSISFSKIQRKKYV